MRIFRSRISPAPSPSRIFAHRSADGIGKEVRLIAERFFGARRNAFCYHVAFNLVMPARLLRSRRSVIKFYDMPSKFNSIAITNASSRPSWAG